MKKISTKQMARGAMIAALYVALTFISSLFGMASGAVQFRLSEVLTILPIFFFEAVPGLYIGCLLANIIAGVGIYDILFGSLATLIGAIGTWAFRKLPEKYHFLGAIPTVLANAIIVPIVIILAYGEPFTSFPYLFLTVGLGELVMAGIGGAAFYFLVRKYKDKL